MASLLPLFVLLPFGGFLLSLLIPASKETLISWVSFGVAGTHFLGAVIFIMYWLGHGSPLLNVQGTDTYPLQSAYDFYIVFYFDKITAIYLLVGALLTLTVIIHSRYYRHREQGYKRFSNIVLFFYLGYNLVIFAGNLETMFIGWESLGIASFLLIAFYRNQYLPVKNAVKVFSIYRFGDVGVLLAIGMSHHLWRENVTFYQLNNFVLAHEHAQTPTLVGVFISLMILGAAAVKSAQLPFCWWLPRAMEGPTPSSAILYGSLSVHVGIFLLLRTMPFWANQLSSKLMIGIVGICTCIIATLTARAQSSRKSQIAYASIAQIGLIFIEVAAGFENLALIHFAGNAFLRTCQLLIPPAVVSYQIRAQPSNFTPRTQTTKATWPRKIAFTVYMLSLREWNLDSIIYQYLWNPMKWVGRKMNFITVKGVLIFFVPGYLLGVCMLFNQEIIPGGRGRHLPIFFALIGLVMVIKSFTEQKNVQLGWLLALLNHFWIALAICFNERFSIHQIYLYLSGVVVAGTVGFLCLQRLNKRENDMDLDRFHGYFDKYPKIALLFLVTCLGLAGFPITLTFIGEGFIFDPIHQDQTIMALFISLCFIVDGLAVIRMYARVFLGPHSNSIYGMANRSS
jgi:NADH-quinone oxidoreductase subunit L